ncbi:leucine-rich repeat and guanylate kinase domain-containing protein isoform C [Alligator mississippiensis]|uniref:Leucine-rich repeat and guanylate kinase domain-containing protein isoform C n=1 Tax=Alligator mississippiensis TaxID=8496 RepID=A0A151NQ97_ALLMI|nr:leucine-rich repeat and guanylate kinase domain-containing protein isoform C [Alligator mississippiensis]
MGSGVYDWPSVLVRSQRDIQVSFVHQLRMDQTSPKTRLWLCGTAWGKPVAAQVLCETAPVQRDPEDLFLLLQSTSQMGYFSLQHLQTSPATSVTA